MKRTYKCNSAAWYHETVLASILWSIAPSDIFKVFSCRSKSIVQYYGAQLPIHTLNYWTELSGVLFFLVIGVLVCSFAHRRSVAVLCMLFKIKPMLPLNGALPFPNMCMLARVTRGALVAHRHSFAPPRCRTSQERRTFVLLSVSLWNDLNYPVSDGVGQTCFKHRANALSFA